MLVGWMVVVDGGGDIRSQEGPVQSQAKKRIKIIKKKRLVVLTNTTGVGQEYEFVTMAMEAVS